MNSRPTNVKKDDFLVFTRSSSQQQTSQPANTNTRPPASRKWGDEDDPDQELRSLRAASSTAAPHWVPDKTTHPIPFLTDRMNSLNSSLSSSSSSSSFSTPRVPSVPYANSRPYSQSNQTSQGNSQGSHHNPSTQNSQTSSLQKQECKQQQQQQQQQQQPQQPQPPPQQQQQLFSSPNNFRNNINLALTTNNRQLSTRNNNHLNSQPIVRQHAPTWVVPSASPPLHTPNTSQSSVLQDYNQSVSPFYSSSSSSYLPFRSASHISSATSLTSHSHPINALATPFSSQLENKNLASTHTAVKLEGNKSKSNKAKKQSQDSTMTQSTTETNTTTPAVASTKQKAVVQNTQASTEKTALAGYGSKEYWNQRYAIQESKYEWYCSWSDIKSLILPELKVAEKEETRADLDSRLRSAVKTLVVGCGNSPLSEDMYSEGFTDLVSVDYSNVVIGRMRELAPSLRFEEMDCRSMSFKDDQFDFIFDKGTLDTILCGVDSKKNGDSMMSEVYRVLQPGGVFVMVSYGKPDNRLPYLQKLRFKWKLSQHSLPAQNTSQFMYILRKQVPKTSNKGSLG